MSPDWCHSCGREEPLPSSGAYIVCLECGHVYVTARELLETFIAEVTIIDSADQIYFCPLCLHDF